MRSLRMFGAWSGKVGLLGAVLVLLPTAASAKSFECLIQPNQVVEIRSPTEGLIEKVYVQRGNSVKAGEPLVQLESRAERSAVAVAKFRAHMRGGIAAARERVAYAEKKLQRQTELQKKHFVAAQALDDAQAELKVAQSELEGALENQELALLEYRHAEDLLALRTLRSPFTGVVTARSQDPGDLAQAGSDSTPILKLAQIDPLRVEVVLPVQYYGELRRGMTGIVSPVGVGGKYRGTIKVIDRVFDAASGTFGVRLEVPNAHGNVPAGIRCHVDFPQLGATPPEADAAR